MIDGVAQTQGTDECIRIGARNFDKPMAKRRSPNHPL